MDSLKHLVAKKLGDERTKREYDLRAMNRVSEGEYESRMIIWDSLSANSISDVKAFVDSMFNKLQKQIETTNRDLTVTYSEFVVMANEEVNYIKVHVADKNVQRLWYLLVTLMVAGVIAISI
ncbi:thiamine-phosphate diphosphorylase [Vibrio makurazakiensis]